MIAITTALDQDEKGVDQEIGGGGERLRTTILGNETNTGMRIGMIQVLRIEVGIEIEMMTRDLEKRDELI